MEGTRGESLLSIPQCYQSLFSVCEVMGSIHVGVVAGKVFLL